MYKRLRHVPATFASRIDVSFVLSQDQRVNIIEVRQDTTVFEQGGCIGDAVGVANKEAVFAADGAAIGEAVGAADGEAVGEAVDAAVGVVLGAADADAIGEAVGTTDSETVDAAVG